MRIEKDTLGAKEVPEDALYGIQTFRAVENFPISGQRAHRHFVWATVVVKKAAAIVNMQVGKLSKELGGAIVKACDEILAGRWRENFVVDVYQAGAGTSHNMNANEVIANRAAEILGLAKGKYAKIHPNDHVNMGQSTNDVFPTAMRLAMLRQLEDFYPPLRELENAFAKKGRAFKHILKSGRTHLQDAVPVTLGQEFNAYSLAMRKAEERIRLAADSLTILGIGGSAVGTGLNAAPGYREGMIRELSKITGWNLSGAKNLFEAMESAADFTYISSAVKNLAVELVRIANDLRLLSSGPRTGFNEIILPPVQPGSSIMPGKVNPVMAEMLNMVGFQVLGNDQAVTYAAQAGQLELNVMMPLMVHNILASLEILKNAIASFDKRCISSIQANRQVCEEFMHKSLGMATVLNPFIGYAKAAEVNQEASRTGKSVKEVILEKKIMPEKELNKILTPKYLTGVE
ncbi:MAG: aspartate ammonia-lyase [Candidatus Omnitrophica bacterium]|nr:aspartate ammonia-lyase [Candidatus Omnitrophota bacterium]